MIGNGAVTNQNGNHPQVIKSEIQSSSSEPREIRVAFYVRVSTDTEEQMNSFENQKAAVDVVLKQHPDYRLVKIYADAGISGTLAEKRPGFMEMIADCEAGKIDLIYTKSLSRWSRNTLECLQYYRALKDIGVSLIFEKESIDTRSEISEMALSIYASFAQEESRSISENTKLGLRMRYEMGQDIWKPIYGYRRDYVIDETEAEVVRTIFDMYERGHTARVIANHLDSKGILSPNQCKWQSTTVLSILRNEKYAGDIIMQKTYVADYLSHRQINNDGTKVPTYTMKEHHTGIVSREQFDRVQMIRELHGGGKNGLSKYPFGNKLICPYCGAKLRQRNFHGGVWGQGRGWECPSCKKFLLRSKDIESAVLTAYNDIEAASVRLRMPSMKSKRKDAAERLIRLKTSEDISKVDFFWVDQLIDTIEFGGFTCDTDRVIMIRWKFGLTSTRQLKSRKTPMEYAEIAKTTQNKPCKRRKSE